SEKSMSTVKTQKPYPDAVPPIKIWAHVPEPPDKSPNVPPGVPPPDQPDEVELPPREDPNKIDEPEIPPVPEPPMKAIARRTHTAFNATHRMGP
ncbi:MAG TPA: hypothetical protein VIR04_06575, partial [Paralcaligenes sp.]